MKTDKTNFLFYSISFLAITIFSYLTYFTNGEILKGILFIDKQDTFMDFFNCVSLGDSPYQRSFIAVYPPLTMFKFYVLGACSGVTVADSIQPWHDVAVRIRCSQVGMTVFYLYSSLVNILLVYLWTCIKKGTYSEKFSFIIVMFFSMPFVYMFERGNNILLSLFFSCCFVYFYQHQNRKVQFFSFSCLAIATSIKISPFIYSLVLLRERKYKDFFLVCVITIVIFFFPFFFFRENILDQLCSMIRNVIISSEAYSSALFPTFFINIKQLLSFFMPELFAMFIRWIVIICGVWEILYCQNLRKWEVFTVLSILAIFIPSFSAVYSLIYMTIPLMLFLDRNIEEYDKNDLVFTFLFLGVFLLIPNLSSAFKISTLVESICILEMIMILEFKGIWKTLKKL